MLENVGVDGQRKSVKHSAEKRPKTTENDQKRPQNVFTASLLRPYRLLTDFTIQSGTSNFPPTKVQKRCVKHRTCSAANMYFYIGSDGFYGSSHFINYE